MNKTAILLFFFCFSLGFISSAQSNYEREHRIRKSQFPEEALNYITENLEDIKRVRFYMEIDSIKNYNAKFKKDRLWYSMDFNFEGALKNIAIAIGQVDIPNDSFAKIETYLGGYFSKYHIRKLQQQYPTSESEPIENTVKKAFQNLIIPDMEYELFVKGKKDGVRTDFEITFDSEGNFIESRNALPANYDRVLY